MNIFHVLANISLSVLQSSICRRKLIVGVPIDTAAGKDLVSISK